MLNAAFHTNDIDFFPRDTADDTMTTNWVASNEVSPNQILVNFSAAEQRSSCFIFDLAHSKLILDFNTLCSM